MFTLATGSVQPPNPNEEQSPPLFIYLFIIIVLFFFICGQVLETEANSCEPGLVSTKSEPFISRWANLFEDSSLWW